MKTPMFHIGMIRRGKGQCRSAVDAAAYIFGETWKSEFDGKTYNYSDKKSEVVYSTILAPEEAPKFVYQPFTFFHAVEWSEKLKSAQLLRHIYFSLPPELSTEQHIALVNDFVGQAFVSMGMVATVAIHHKNDNDGKPNPNAHVLLNTRPLLPDGTWAPKNLTSFCLDENGKRIIGENGKCKRKNVKTTDWNYQGNGEIWRRLWADITNKHLQLPSFRPKQGRFDAGR